MTAVLGVDLASARWTFNGSAQLHFNPATGTVTRVVPGAITWPGPGTPLTPQVLADAVHVFAVRTDVGAVALDGPQAWRIRTRPRMHLAPPGADAAHAVGHERLCRARDVPDLHLARERADPVAGQG